MKIQQIEEKIKKAPTAYKPLLQDALDQHTQKIESLELDLQNSLKEINQLKKTGTAARAIGALEKEREENKKTLKEMRKNGVNVDAFIQKMGAQSSEFYEELISKTEKAMTGPLRKEVFDLLNTLDKNFDQYEKKANVLMKKEQKNAAEASADLVELFFQEKKFFDKIFDLIAIQEIKIRKAKPAPINKEWPESRRRVKFAQTCVAAALYTLKDARGWIDKTGGEIDMVSMCISDAKNHYDLGLAFLNGSKARIQNASNMDTAPREDIDDAAWSFITHDVYDDDYKKIKPKMPK